MYKTYLHKAIEAVPELGNRISLFTKKLRLAQYADSTIYNVIILIYAYVASQPLVINIVDYLICIHIFVFLFQFCQVACS